MEGATDDQTDGIKDGIWSRFSNLEGCIDDLLARVEALEHGGSHRRQPAGTMFTHQELCDIGAAVAQALGQMAGDGTISNARQLPSPQDNQERDPMSTAPSPTIILEAAQHASPVDLDQLLQEAEFADETCLNAEPVEAELARGSACTELTTMDLMLECQIYIEPSTWNVPLFIGLPNISLSESFLATCLWYTNIILQFALCWIIQEFFQPEQIELEDAKRWRWSVGHALKYASESGHSLTQRMCGGGHSSVMEMSSQVSSALANDLAYSKRFLHPQLQGGAVLTFICVLLWFFLLCEEIQSMTRLMRGLARLPRGDRSKLAHVRQGTPSEALAVVALTKRRFAAVSLSLFARLVTVTFLAYSGTVWLARENEVQELLLNCTALTLILQVDEILFKAMGPMTMQCIIKRLDPVTFREPDPVKGWSSTLRPIFKMLIATAFMLWCMLDHVLPTARHAKDMEGVLCGGNTHFTVANQFATGLAVAFNDTPDSNKPTPSAQVARYLATGKDPYAHSEALSFTDLQLKTSWSLEDYNARLGQCADANASENEAVWTALGYVLDSQTPSSCANLPLKDCFKPDAIIRIACPVRCGCREPMFGTFVLKGCDLSRCAGTTEYKQARAQLRSTDPHPEVLLSLQAWHNYWEAFEMDMTRVVERNTLDLGKKEVRRIRSMFSERGCEAFADVLLAEHARRADYLAFFCAENSQRRPLRAFCPGSCDCSQRGRPTDMFCPPPVPAASCPRIWVVGATSLDCEHALPGNSSPTGLYSCQRQAYNHRNLYTRTDEADVVWTIRFETVNNLDWGAIYFGQLANASNKSKWVIESQLPTTSNRSSQYFMLDEGQNGLAIPNGTWSPCTNGSTNASTNGSTNGSTSMWLRNYSTMMVNRWARKCLTFYPPRRRRPPVPNGRVRIAACEDIGEQMWYFHGTNLRSNYWQSRCLEYNSNESDPNHLRIAIARCNKSGHQANQSFEMDVNGRMRLMQDTSKCLVYHMKAHVVYLESCTLAVTDTDKWDRFNGQWSGDLKYRNRTS